jgi:chitinase
MSNAKAFPIIAYICSENLSEIANVPYDKITHINYSFALPTPEGEVTGINAEALALLVKLAHDHGVKVSLAVGGWNDGDISAFEALAAVPARRGKLIHDLNELCDKYSLDGIDMDWEYPKASSADSFVALMKVLSHVLHKKGRTLSVAVIAMDDEHGQFILPAIFGYVDFLNIMAYDWHYQDGRHHSPLSLAEASLDYWLQRGCPKEKAILGVPFYGRSPSVVYKELIRQDPGAAERDQVGSIHYNGRTTMQKKTEVALKKGGGIMFWEISQDTGDQTSLLKVIYDTVNARHLD